MYCPNCAAKNKKKQNYCRYCGLHLQDIEKSFLSQQVFGKESERYKQLRSIKQFLGYGDVLVGALLIAGIGLLIFPTSFSGMSLVKASLGLFIVLQAIQQMVGYFQRKNLNATGNQDIAGVSGQSEVASPQTSKLIEDREFSPVTSVTENSTVLLQVESRKQ